MTMMMQEDDNDDNVDYDDDDDNDDNDNTLYVCVCGGQKVTLESQFSPSVFIQVPGIELWLSGLHGKCLYHLPEEPSHEPNKIYIFRNK